MIRICCALMLLLGLARPAFLAEAQDGGTALAPAKGFVYVQTSYPFGGRAPFVPFTITKLSGSYPLPPGPFMTDGWGKVWVALYPGVYRFQVQDATPPYIDVSVASNSESYIFFWVNAPEMSAKAGSGLAPAFSR